MPGWPQLGWPQTRQIGSDYSMHFQNLQQHMDRLANCIAI
jgi:hypothetical protein